MSYFQQRPPIGGLLGDIQIPDYAAGVQSAMAQNAATPKPKKDMWWLGALGDAMLGLAGQPGVYGPAMMRQRQDEEARTRDWADWQKKEQWKRDNQAPDIPELAKTVGYYRSIGRNDIADDLEAKARMVTIQRAEPTGEVRTLFERPSTLMGGSSSAPVKAPAPGTVEDGYMFKGGDPADQSNWEPVGGAGLGAPRPFR